MMTVTKKMPIELFNESRKRGLLLVCIYLFPVFFTAIIFLLIVIISDIDFKVTTHESKYASIESPQNRSSVSKKFEISGIINTPLENHSYFLLEYRNQLYWPKFDLGNKANSWSKTLTYRGKQNQYSTYQVVMADITLKKTIDNWFKTAKDSGKYPGIKDLSIDNVVANIRVNSL